MSQGEKIIVDTSKPPAWCESPALCNQIGECGCRPPAVSQGEKMETCPRRCENCNSDGSCASHHWTCSFAKPCPKCGGRSPTTRCDKAPSPATVDVPPPYCSGANGCEWPRCNCKEKQAATVDVGEARPVVNLMDALKASLAAADIETARRLADECDCYDTKVADTIRSLASALEASEKKVAGLEKDRLNYLGLLAHWDAMQQELDEHGAPRDWPEHERLRAAGMFHGMPTPQARVNHYIPLLVSRATAAEALAREAGKALTMLRTMRGIDGLPTAEANWIDAVIAKLAENGLA